MDSFDWHFGINQWFPTQVLLDQSRGSSDITRVGEAVRLSSYLCPFLVK